METLFGELPVAARFFIAFLIVLALIVLTFWAIRRFGGIGIGTGAARGRQPRLAVIDAAAVDGRRRLVLIRRDNVEHLLMIGGPSDIVVEQNIVRAVPVPSAREAPASRATGLTEVMARAAEPAPAPRETSGRVTAETRNDRPDDHPRLAGTVRTEPAMPRGSELPALRPEGLGRPEATARHEPAPPHRAGEPVVRPPASVESRARLPEMPVRPAPPLTPAPKPAPEPAVSAHARPAPPASDAELTDMAQRLEAALRRPVAPGQPRHEPGLAKPAPEAGPRPSPVPFGAPPVVREAGKPPAAKPEAPRAAPSETAHPGQPDAKPKSVLDSLEQEMASLLGRPAGKE
jgi:flagellar protein FliO/FliZ